MQTITVNAIGDACPLPVVKATRALGEMKEAGTVLILVDNETAVQNLSRLAAGHKLPCQTEKLPEGQYRVTMTLSGPLETLSLEKPAVCHSGAWEGTVVAVPSDTMGQGSEELGKTLMKGFLFAVTQLPRLPKTMLFYNSGAKLTVQGSDSLEDLASLEAQGVEILTCGTCLNYYGLTDRLAVGSVTNMYSIVETLTGADKVVRP